MADAQLRQTLQDAFQEVDKDRKGQIDAQDVEQALRRFRDNPECRQKMDDDRVRQEAAHFRDQGRPVSQQEFVDYYADRLRQEREDDQLRQALQRAFQAQDKDRRGQIDAQDVENALRRLRDDPECRQRMDDARVRQEAAHFRDQGRPVSQQEFVDYYAHRLRQEREDDQLRQALQRAFQAQDKDRRGQIDAQDVEQALRRLRDDPECRQKMDDARVRQEAAHFRDQGRPVSQQEFVDYYADRLRQEREDDQLRQALQRAFQAQDKERTGQIDAQDVEQALRRLRDDPECRQRLDDDRIKQEAAHFRDQGRRVNQQEFVDYYADRLRQEREDDQLRQALQRAFQEQDKDRRGQIDAQDVEQTLRRLRDDPECRLRLDDDCIRQDAARFRDQDRPVTQQEFVDYYQDRLREENEDAQLRQALQNAFQEQDRYRRGQIDAQDVERALRRFREDNRECRQRLDDDRIRQAAAHFRDQRRPVSQQEFVDYYQDRIRQEMDDAQLRQTLQRAFQDQDRDRRGQIEAQDVERALRRLREDNRECRQRLDDDRIKQAAAHFRDQGRPVSQQEFMDYYQDRLRQEMDDAQLRQALQRAFQEQDRDRRGQIDAQDVEQTLRRLRDNRECRRRLDDDRIRQAAAHFRDQRRPVNQQEFMDYYEDRLRQEMDDARLRQALQNAFQEQDRDRRGQVDSQDVEQALRRLRDNRECRQRLDDDRIRQAAAHFRDQGRPVSQQEFVDYYQDRLRQEMDDAQLRQALRNAFQEQDRDRRGQIDAQDVEKALRRLRDNRECRQRLDDDRIRQAAAHFRDQGRPVTQQEFVDYYQDRLRQDRAHDQLRQALQRAFQEQDRDRKGQIDAQDVERALRRLRDNRECRQRLDDDCIRQAAAHFRDQGRPVTQQEFMDYYEDRIRQEIEDAQLRQALQNAFQEQDRDRRGQIDAQDVERALRRLRDNRECRQRLDDDRIRQAAAHFRDQGRPVTQQEFVDYYEDRLTREREDDQLRQALQRAFQEQDKDRRGQIDAKDVENALRRLGDDQDCRQRLVDDRIRQTAAHFREQGRPVNQQEFLNYCVDRLRQEREDDQLRQALQNAFQEQDRDRKGQIDAQDVENALRRLRDRRDRRQRLDDARIRQEAAHFRDQGRQVTQQEFVDYYADRLRQ